MIEVYKSEEEKQAALRKDLAKEHSELIEQAMVAESPLAPETMAQPLGLPPDAEVSFPNPEMLTSSERVALINKYRDMVQRQEDVSELELRHAVSLIVVERAMHMTAKVKKKETVPEVAPGSSLSAF